MEAPLFLFLQQKTSSRLSSLTVLSMLAFITTGIISLLWLTILAPK